MVSTRSGKVVSNADSLTTATRRATSRPRKTDAGDSIAEELEVHDEATSPLPAAYGAARAPEPSPARGVQPFGSPMPEDFPQQQTPIREAAPFTERIIKTVGRTISQQSNRTPQPARSTAARAQTPLGGRTPTAKEVQQVAELPLPDDTAAEADAFATSDSDAAPSSPARPAALQAEHVGSGRLLKIFTVTSILVTLLVAVFLAPCGDIHLYARMPHYRYGPICKRVMDINGYVNSITSRVRTQATDSVSALHAKLPPTTQNHFADAWGTAWKAHRAALSAAAPAAMPAQHALGCIKQTWQKVSRAAATRLVPLLDKILPGRAGGSNVGSVAGSSGPSVPLTFMPQAAFLALLDAAPRTQLYATEAWDAAGHQIAIKRKAPAWVLTCRHAEECDAISSSVFTLDVPLMSVNGAAYSIPEAAASLQGELVNFLRANPAGLVLVTEVDRLDPSAVSILNAAMSESGHLTMDGAPVATERAVYLFVWRTAHSPDAHSYDHDVKAEVMEAIIKGDPSDVPPDGQVKSDSSAAILRSFRRRLDAVLPAHRLPEAGTQTTAEEHQSTGEAAEAA